MTIAISVENLGKLYRLGLIGGTTLREDVGRWWARVRGEPDPLLKVDRVNRGDGGSETIWALQDVNLEVRRGEIVGIIGRNGAGKSTLLKILSRITAPTEGEAKLRGRVGSLLEVGTGFHPELTGRENVYLNGAILGMRRAEVDRRFDEIVEFSGVAKFIETPVKRYSSGMRVRLAFAVAAHLEPEILIVDEVLAVGDATFQKKCLGKMGEVASGGRTVLFVSHNMTAITRLCPRTILLDAGRVAADGPSHEVVKSYLRSDVGTSAERLWRDMPRAPGNEIARLRAMRIRTEDGRISDVLDIRKPIAVEMELEVLEAGHVLVPNFHFFNEQGVCLFVAFDSDPEWRRRTRVVGRYVSTAWIPANFLAEGCVVVGAGLTTLEPIRIHFHEREAVAFQVVDSLDGDSARGDFARSMPGLVRPLLRWTNEFHAPGNGVRE